MKGILCVSMQLSLRTPNALAFSARSLSTASLHHPVVALNKHVAIVGGGLAGLSTAYHLLQKSPSTKITILDKSLPGTGGASAVAAGLIHPLSPRGKLAKLGLEGLSVTNKLLQAASAYEANVVLQDEIYRVALNSNHVSTLKTTAKALPSLSEWLEPSDLPWNQPPEVLGALRLHQGCKVVNIPSYLKGLWKACADSADGHVDWQIEDYSSDQFDWTKRLSSFDTVILSAGAGLFQDSIVQDALPAQLVRGQSVELQLEETTLDCSIVCGKYVSPLADENRVLIGATHEFEQEALPPDVLAAQLRDKTVSFVPEVWEDGTIDKITSGFRVQSNRGQSGRMPILGPYNTDIHGNAWIFTGLSSRGLLYHGVFGSMLSNMILGLEGEDHDVDLDWWRK